VQLIINIYNVVHATKASYVLKGEKNHLCQKTKGEAENKIFQKREKFTFLASQ